MSSLMSALEGRVHPLKVAKMSDYELDQHFSKRFLDEMENEFQTGDLILCRGTESFSVMIRRGTMSTWSHAAIIVVDPSPAIREAYKIDRFWEEDQKERVFIFESDTETQDKRTGGGTQLFPFRRWMKCCIEEYSPQYLVVWRKLKRPSHQLTIHDHELFSDWEKYMLSMCKRSYEHSRAQLVKSALHRNKDEDLSTIFCSELVAASFKHMGLLPPDTNSNNFVPRDFTSNERIDGKDIKLLRDFSLENEVRLRLRPSDGVEFFLGSSIEDINAKATTSNSTKR